MTGIRIFAGERVVLRKRFLIMLSCLVLLLSGCQAKTVKIEEKTASLFAMDTSMTIRLIGGSEELLSSLQKRVSEVENQVSVTREDSDVYILNHDHIVSASEDTYAIISRALDLCRETDGALDISVYPVVREWGFTTGAYQVPNAAAIAELLKNVDYKAVKIDGGVISVPENMSVDLGSVTKGYTGEILAEMIAADEAAAAEKAKNAAATDSLLQKKYVIPFILAVVILACNQTTGINSVLNYTVTIFQKTGMQGAFANMSDVAIKIVNCVMTVVACALVDRKGRKFLLKLGTGGIIVGLCGVGSVFLAISKGWCAASMTTGIVATAFFFMFIGFFAVGPGVCVWLALTELMPTRIRANGMAIAMIINQGVSAGIATVFPKWCAATNDNGTVFFVLAGFTVIYFVTAAFFLPETKGRTLEEVEQYFTTGKMPEKKA